jgi:hypothetical protein
MICIFSKATPYKNKMAVIDKKGTKLGQTSATKFFDTPLQFFPLYT